MMEAGGRREMKSFGKDVVGVCLRSSSIVMAVMVFAIVMVMVSIIGVDRFAGLGVIPLSTTAVAYAGGDAGRQLSDVAADHIEVSDSVESRDDWRVVQMRVTAYCGCSKCCGEYSDGLTANMHKIQDGDAFVAADKKYAFGTELVVPGYNLDRPVKVMDRGGAIKGDRLDVFFNSHKQALRWGVRYLEVKVRI